MFRFLVANPTLPPAVVAFWMVAKLGRKNGLDVVASDMEAEIFANFKKYWSHLNMQIQETLNTVI